MSGTRGLRSAVLSRDLVSGNVCSRKKFVSIAGQWCNTGSRHKRTTFTTLIWSAYQSQCHPFRQGIRPIRRTPSSIERMDVQDLKFPNI
jgi:hypothetical protein